MLITSRTKLPTILKTSLLKLFQPEHVGDPDCEKTYGCQNE
jgi:hypothetical protein